MKDRLEQAEEAIKSVYKNNGGARRGYTRLGIALVEAGLAQRAPRYFEADVALKRQSPAVWVEYAAAFWAQGDRAKAESIIQGAYAKLSAANDGYGRAAERAHDTDPSSAWERDLQAKRLSPEGVRRYMKAALRQHGLLAAIEVGERCKDLLPPKYYCVAAECVAQALHSASLDANLCQKADQWLSEAPWADDPQSLKQREALNILSENNFVPTRI